MRIKIGLLSSLVFLFLVSVSFTQSEAGLNPPMIIEPIETGLAGSPSTIMVKNAIPNFPGDAGGVEYFFSFNIGTTNGKSAICPGTSLDLNKARFLGRRLTNQDGNSSLVIQVPAIVEGMTVYFQVIDTEDCTKSDRVELTFGPPIQEFDLFLNPLIPGQAGKFNVFSVNFATPLGSVRYIWGFNPGSENGSGICPGFVADIDNFRNLGIKSVDAFGNTLGGFFIPHAAAGLAVLIQAVDLNDCSRKSNVLSTTF